MPGYWVRKNSASSRIESWACIRSPQRACVHVTTYANRLVVVDVVLAAVDDADDAELQSYDCEGASMETLHCYHINARFPDKTSMALVPLSIRSSLVHTPIVRWPSGSTCIRTSS